MMCYKITMYGSTEPKTVIFDGLATLSGLLAFLKMLYPEAPDDAYDYIQELVKAGVLEIKSTDTQPYPISITNF